MDWEDVLRRFSIGFLQRREVFEGFDATRHSFYIHDPEMQYLSCLLTGYITDFYYLKPAEVFQLAMPLHRTILDKSPEYHLTSLKIAREFGAMKDQVLIGILLWTKHTEREKHKETLIDLLASFPPNQIVRKFINTKRQTNLFGGLGTFEKKIIKEVFERWKEQGKISYYFAKYRRYIQQIVNIAHLKIDPKEFSYLSSSTKYNGDDEYLKKISEFLRTKDISVLPENTPFELIRANIPKREWNSEIIEKSDMTGNTLVLQACSLYSALGDDILQLVRKVIASPTVTSDKIMKALIMAEIKGYEKLAEKLAKAYAEKVKQTYKQLLLPFEMPSICLVVDASGSMNPNSLKGVFLKAISTTAPFSPLIKKLVLFSEKAGYENEQLLKNWQGILKLINIAERRYNTSTNIDAGLKLAIEQAKSGEIDTVIVATDEQANVTTEETTEMDLIRRLLDMGIKVIVLNPTPYPIHVTDIKDKRLIYIPAPNPEAVVGAIKLIQIRKELQRCSAREVMEKLVAISKKKKTEDYD